MYRSFALVVAVLAIPLAAEGQSVEVGRADTIRQLHQAYASTNDYVDRLLIASKLARNGDMTYWSSVRKEAEKAVRHGQKAPRSLPPIRFGPRKPGDAFSLAVAVDNRDNQNKSTFREDIDVDGDKKTQEAIETDLDVWRIFAFANGAPQNEKELLQTALASPRPLVACTAALGLARLHDLGSVDQIKAAADRHPNERMVFIEALVYLNDENATRIAVALSGRDETLIKSLHEVAVANLFDPFFTTDERW